MLIVNANTIGHIILVVLGIGIVTGVAYLVFLPVPRKQGRRELSFSIAGINKRGLTDDDLGDYEGEVRCDYDNEYDDYALAVYTDEGKHVGFIPRGNVSLFERIDRAGGSVPCELWIEQGEEDDRTFYYGRVIIRL